MIDYYIRMQYVRGKVYSALRSSERFFKTDMVYLARGSFWINLNVTIVIFLSFLLSIAYAHFLPKDVYGTYQFIISIGTIITALTLTGMNQSVIQSVSRGFEGTYLRSIRTQLVHGILPFLVGLSISIYYLSHGNSNIAAAIFVISFFQPIVNTFNTYSAFIIGKKDYRTWFIYSQYTNFFYYTIMIGSVVFVRDPLLLILVNLVSNTLITIALHFATVRKYRPNSEFDKNAIVFSKHLSLANIISGVISRADNILVYHYLGPVNLAVYSFATIIPERINGLLKSVSISALPKFSERSREEIKKNLFKKTALLGFITLLLASLYIATAPFMYKYVFPQYTSSILYSQIYFLVIVIGSLSSLPLTGLIATQSKKDLYIYNTVQPIINLTSMIILINFFGIMGPIISKGISNIAGYILLTYIWKK